MLLADAAEVEHNIMCQYLFAAFSLKRREDEGLTPRQLETVRRWYGELLLIARQEMGHLAGVCNLLTAIGETPVLGRSDFPLELQRFPLEYPTSLDPFNRDTVARLIAFERPDTLDLPNATRLERGLGLRTLTSGAKNSLGALYRSIEALIDDLPETELFIGSSSSQVVTPEGASFPARVGAVRAESLYDVHLDAVTDRRSATLVIRRIVEEGEGGGSGDRAGPGSADPQGAGSMDRVDSHFGRLVLIAQELADTREKDRNFQPARPVVVNPAGAGTLRESQTPIENRATLRVAELFDLAYATTLSLLVQQFGLAEATSEELRALEQVVYFPMMTQVIRPLGEILTELPATEGCPVPTAGPAFFLGRPPALVAHRATAWRRLHRSLYAMHVTARALSKAPDYPPRVRTRLQLMHENLARMATDFRRGVRRPTDTW